MSAITIPIDHLSTVAPYEQVRSSIAGQAASGELPVGTRLPPVRRLADDLGLAPGTVARAYRDLESAGVVVTRGRAGTFVAAGADLARRQVADAAAVFAQRVREVGVDAAEALAMAEAALRGAGPGGA